MKTLEMNLNESPHPNSLILWTWYQISTLHIPPSLVLSYYPEHAVVFVLCLCAFLTGISFIEFFSIFCPLIFINPQLPHTFWDFLLKTSNFFFILILTHTFNSQRIKILLKRKTKPVY